MELMSDFLFLFWRHRTPFHHKIFYLNWYKLF